MFVETVNYLCTCTTVPWAGSLYDAKQCWFNSWERLLSWVSLMMKLAFSSSLRKAS